MESLRVAAARTTRARAVRLLAVLLRTLKKPVRRLASVAPDAALRIQETLAGVTPPPAVSDEDKWSLAETIETLRGAGWKPHRIAKALIEVKAVRGDSHREDITGHREDITGHREDIKRALRWMRQTRKRYRAARDKRDHASRGTPLPLQTVGGSGLTIEGDRDEPGRNTTQEHTMAARLIQRVTETFLDEDEELQLPEEANEDEELEEEEEEQDAEDCDGEEECR